MIKGTRWQPVGNQFAWACRVCRNATAIGGDTCDKCLREVQSGFEFDHRLYMERQAKLDDEKIMLFGGQRGGGKIFHLEQILSVKCAQLKATEEDRDRWESAALFYRDRYNKQKQEENTMNNEQKKAVDMTFGDALEAMKDGQRVARKGWNGKGMYVFLAYEPDFVTDADISAFDQMEVEVGDMLVMKTAQNTFQPGWLASQADMLAEDWYIVE